MQAAQPDAAVVLAHAGDHVEVGRVQVEVVHEAPLVVVAWTRQVWAGLGWSRSGMRVTALRAHIGALPSRSTTGSTGLAMLTQINPSLPRAMLSG